MPATTKFPTTRVLPTAKAGPPWRKCAVSPAPRVPAVMASRFQFPNPTLFENTRRYESIDMSEIVRRWNEGIYDSRRVRARHANGWMKISPSAGTRTRLKWPTPEKKREVLEKCEDGDDRPRFDDWQSGWREWALRRKAAATTRHRRGLPRQRQWTDHMPTAIRWNPSQSKLIERHPRAVRHRHLKTICSTASPCSWRCRLTLLSAGDVRTYWSPEAVERVNGWKPDGLSDGFIHLINSGSVTLTPPPVRKTGKPAMKPRGDYSGSGRRLTLRSIVKWRPVLLPRGGYSSHLSSSGMPLTMSPEQRSKALPGTVDCRGLDLGTRLRKCTRRWTSALDPTADHRVCAAPDGHGRLSDVYSVMNNWGANHGAFHYAHWRRPDYAGGHAAYSRACTTCRKKDIFPPEH